LVGHAFGFYFFELFAQLGNGINTKVVDVGVNLIDKVEKGILKNDPKSLAIIVDLVSLHFIVVNSFNALLSLFVVCYNHFNLSCIY
jgi:Na+/H+-translocating membrane pyrophosphatase